MPAPSMKPLPSLPFNAPTGQAGVQGLFDAPLVGRPEPMGSTVDATLVRVQIGGQELLHSDSRSAFFTSAHSCSEMLAPHTVTSACAGIMLMLGL